MVGGRGDSGVVWCGVVRSVAIAMAAGNGGSGGDSVWRSWWQPAMAVAVAGSRTHNSFNEKGHEQSENSACCRYPTFFARMSGTDPWSPIGTPKE